MTATDDELEWTDEELEWYEPMDYFSTCDEETGSQRLPITDLNRLRWEAGDLVELGIEFHIAECSRPECTEPGHPGYVLRQRYSDGMGPAWGYCTTRDALHGFLRGIHFGAAEHQGHGQRMQLPPAQPS
jgi:hypothetical protein